VQDRTGDGGYRRNVVRSRRDIALENVVLLHQPEVALRNQPASRLREQGRVLGVWLRYAEFPQFRKATFPKRRAEWPSAGLR
jgi:hypothetical protein